MTPHQRRIIIFAKAPLAGFAKTRLIPVLGEDGAANLAHQLLEHALTEALASGVGSVELCVTPLEHEFWARYKTSNTLVLSGQGSGDLGERMASATARALIQHEQVILMGTDCPGLNRYRLHDAAEQLALKDACLIPVSDGGYALMGLKMFDSSVFEGIPWSTEKVSELTFMRFQALGWQVASLAPLHDIDDAQDLKYLPKIFMKNKGHHI